MLNAFLVSVVVLIILCILKLNVLISLIIATLVAGIFSGHNFTDTINLMINNMGSNANIALSYVLLGIFAAILSKNGVVTVLLKKIVKLFGDNKYILLLSLAFIACLSQNLIPIHIAFIPIFIPSLLPILNKLNIDRRSVACALSFGLEMPYISIPFGFGAIFHTLIYENLNINGLKITYFEILIGTLILGISLIFGFLFSIFISYKKPRKYNITESDINVNYDDIHLKSSHYIVIFAVICTIVLQIITGSMPLSALVGILIMIIFKVIEFNEIDNCVKMGIELMGFISFVMLIASGYGAVLKNTGAIDSLVNSSLYLFNNNKFIAAFIMLLIGLFITMGIGTSFGTIPILAVIYVPFCIKMGFSSIGTVIIIAAAAALGDAGSPVSDTTLGPSSGLCVDNQHNHIKDTCIPTFIHYNIPLIIFGTIFSVII